MIHNNNNENQENLRIPQWELWKSWNPKILRDHYAAYENQRIPCENQYNHRISY